MADLPAGLEPGPPPDPTLKDVAQRESGGRNLPPEANVNYNVKGPRHSEASGIYQFEPATWRGATRATGVGREAATANLATPDEQVVNAEWIKQKYGVNSSAAWAASAPKGGYKDTQLPEGLVAGPAPKPQELPPGLVSGPAITQPHTQMGMPGPGRPQMGPPMPAPPAPGPMDPSIAARTVTPQAQPGPGTEVQANPFGDGGHQIASMVATPSQWAQMASDPKNPMWQRVGLGIAELGKRYGQAALDAAGVFGDVATGKAKLEDPETQQRVISAAAFYGSRAAPGERPAGVMAQPGEEAALPTYRIPDTGEGSITINGKTINYKDSDVVGADWRAPSAMGSSVTQAGAAPNEASIAARRAPPSMPEPANINEDLIGGANRLGRIQRGQGSVKDLTDHIKGLQEEISYVQSEGPHAVGSPAFGHIQQLQGELAETKAKLSGTPVSAGAAAVPTHEVLAENIRAREATLTATDPMFKQGMRRAANAVKSVFSPETARNLETGEQGGLKAAAHIRGAEGPMEQQRQQAGTALNTYYKAFNGVSPEEGLTVLKWMQDPASRKTGIYQPSPETEGFMKTFADRMQKIQRILETTDKTADMQFRENFVTGLWQNPKEVMPRLMGKAGSSYFTKAKVWQSYEEGIRAGGIPVSTNPLEIGLRYIDNATRAVTQNKILEAGEDSGDVIFRGPDQPVPLQGSAVKLKGRAETYRPGQIAYASPEYAQVYNNYVQAKGGGDDLLGRIQTLSNATTMTQLALSGFHAMLSLKESVASGLSNAIDNIAGGHVITGVTKAVLAPAEIVLSPIRARKAIEAYLDESGLAGNPKTQKAVKALVAANFRVVGKGNITDEYKSSFLPDFFDSIKKGRLKMEAAQATADIKNHPILGLGRQTANLVTRSLDTFSAPTFKVLVPHLKTGAALDMMNTYMRRMPNATDDELAAYARKVSDTIDNRFGEMNHDNIFLKGVQKRWMQALLVSSSYAYGTGRLFANAIGDSARFATGRGPWTSEMSYPIAAFGATALVNGIYQYLKTGKLPESAQDLMNPQSGGTDPKTGKPGRATLPDQMNQVFGLYWNGPAAATTDKINGIWKTAWGLATMLGQTGGEDFRGDPLVNKNNPVTQQLEQAAHYAMDNFIPFSAMNMQAQEGSALSGPERFMGIRDAPRRAVDPEGSAQGMRYVNAQKEITRRQHVKNKSDPDALPDYIPHKAKQGMIQQEMNRYRQ